MSKGLELYRSIISFIWQAGVRLNDLRNFKTLCWAIVGLITSGTVHLSIWSLYRPGKVKASSKERQFSRWLHNDKIKANEVYRELANLAFIDWQDEKAELALDPTMLWNKCAVVRVSIIYRGRSLPLCWVVLEQKSATVAFIKYEMILREAAQLLPSGCKVTLLADRGFNDVELMKLCTELGWHFVIRLKGSIVVHRPFKRRSKIINLLPRKGEIYLFDSVQITDRRFGPVYLAIGHMKTLNGHEKWALVSDLPTCIDTFDTYALRFDIEESFLDDKSGGFQVESSQIDDADALSRLFLILAIATLYLVSTGTAIVEMGRRPAVDTHWHRGLSYFKIGWRWIEHALSTGKKLLNFPWLVSGDDPEPVFASKSQAAIPLLSFSAIHFIE